MKEYSLKISKQALRDLEKIQKNKFLLKKAKLLLEVLQNNPLQTPPAYEKLTGDLSGYYSRRLNIQHRIVYQIREEEKVVAILRMWTHYE